MNGIEQDFLHQIRNARPEDCKTIIEALQTLDGQQDETGELTDFGLLVGACIEELTVNGILKRDI